MLSCIANINESARPEEAERLSPCNNKRMRTLLCFAEKPSSTQKVAANCSFLARFADIDGYCVGRPQLLNERGPLLPYRSHTPGTCKKKTCVVNEESAAANSLPKKRKAVTLSVETAQVHYIDSNDTEPSSDLFYSREELQEMKRSAKRLCRSVGDTSALAEAYETRVRGNPSNDETIVESANKLQKSADFCRKRGLERWMSPHHALSRCMTICHARSEVFLEQAVQVREGRSDPAKVAKIYAKASRPSVRFARVLGLVDHAIATENVSLADEKGVC